jgi:hypothetical protein
MADELQTRFSERKNQVDRFYRYLDGTYKNLTRIPEDSESEYRQKQYIVGELRELQRQMDVFIVDLQS